MSDLLRKAFARLYSLREAVADYNYIRDPYLDEHVEILETLQAAGIDTKGFEIPESAVDDDGRGYVADGDIFRMKLSALLTYFTFENSSGPMSEQEVQDRVKIGFASPARHSST